MNRKFCPGLQRNTMRVTLEKEYEDQLVSLCKPYLLKYLGKKTNEPSEQLALACTMPRNTLQINSYYTALNTVQRL